MEAKFPNFVHLHVHSHYSMLDGMGKVPNLVKKAKADGQTALAITDHGVMHGVVEFYEECTKQGIKPLLGVEAYVAARTRHDKQPRIDQHSYHLILLAKNEKGYKNLLKLVTIAHLEGYYYKPRIDKEVLKLHAEGLIACSACIQGEVARAALESLDRGREKIREYLEIFPKEDFYLEVQKHSKVEQQEAANKAIFQLAKEFDLKVVATNDAHYVNSDDDIAQDALICLQTGRVISDEKRLSMVGDDYSLLTREQMARNFPDHPEVMANTQEIAEKCNVKLELGGIIIPDFPVPSGHNIDSYFKEKCYLGLNMRYGTQKISQTDLPKDHGIPSPEQLYITKEIWDRYLYEYGVISHMDYQGYLLIVADYVQWAKDQGIAVGPGRGSGAGSIITYSFNITDLDPLQFDLLFERFLNPDRISMPDIDMDFADARRSEVIEYVSNKYGKDHVAQIITFGTMAARMAIRDVGRVLSMTYSEVDLVAKLIPAGMTLQEALNSISELKGLYNSEAKVKECIDIAKKLEGVVRHSSMHAAGVVISKEPLTEYCPLQEAQKGDISVLTQFEGTIIEHLGLLKMDFLGLSNLTIIQNALSIIRKTRGENIDITKIPQDDKESYKLLSRGDTTGVFQLESDGMKRYLKELKPSVFEDIIAMVALYRPGPMQWIDKFIARKHGKEPITYAHPKAKAALENTYGIIVYQEQVMQMSKDMAGFTGGQADTLRKAMGKKIKELMEKMGREFIEGCVKNGVEKEIAESLYQAMQDFAQYAFNKSHAACYALIAYQTAYLKAHYPSEFMAALMTSNKDDLDKLAIEIDECKRMNIEVLPPCINESFVDFGVVKETGNIRFGLSAIKNVGQAVAEEIVAERKNGGEFKDLRDFLIRLSGKVANKKSLESLAMAGALSELGERGELLFNMDKILTFSSNVQKIMNSQQDSLFGSEKSLDSVVIDLEKANPADKKQILSWERELLGMYISEHPLSDIGHLLEKNRTIKISEISPGLENKFVRIAGVITTMQKILTRNNQNMVFAKVEDLSSNVEVLFFPKTLESFGEVIQNDRIISIDGFVSYKDGAPKILAENAYELTADFVAPAFTPKERNRYSRKKEGTAAVSPPRTFSAPAAAKMVPSLIKITLPTHFSKNELDHLREVITDDVGDTPISIIVTKDDGTTKSLKLKNKVSINPVFLNKLKSLIGKDNFEIC
ncbi:MAG: DNA polymerase III subunit alpha [Patescibacteria group bacterium]